MLITIPIQSAKNLLLDMAESAEIDRGTSSIIRSAKILLALVDMAEDAEIDEDNGRDDETVKRSTLSKKPNVFTRYLTSLYSEKRWVSFDRFGYGWGSQLGALSEWLQAKFADITNETFIRSARPTSFFNITLYQLSSNNLGVLVLLWIALLF